VFVRACRKKKATALRWRDDQARLLPWKPLPCCCLAERTGGLTWPHGIRDGSSGAPQVSPSAGTVRLHNPTAPQTPRRTEEPARTATHRAKYPGPTASRDEYLAYVHSLIRQHYNMLPLAMVGGRRGETRVEFLVLDDGTIAMVRVRQSSGYPDIDARVEQMIVAVRRVPPLPQWFQGPNMALILDLPFPDALRE